MENGFVNLLQFFKINLFVFLQMNLKSELSNQLGPIDLSLILINRPLSRLIVGDPD